MNNISQHIQEQINLQSKNSKINYDLIMTNTLKSLDKDTRLLIHSCCAVCSTAALYRLSSVLDVTIYFYNPNIHPKSEYLRRAKAQEKFIIDFNEYFNTNVKYIVEDYKYKQYTDKVKGFEDYTEKSGVRCKECYSMRMDVCAKKARDDKYDMFATTLTLSPLKNAQVINNIGLEISKLADVAFLVADFKKNKGNIKATELCNKFDVYRQCYCGCHFAYQEQSVNIKDIVSEARKYLNT